MSGFAAADGIEFKNGLEPAAAEINAAGGILGRPIELHIEDTKEMGADLVTQSMQRLIDRYNTPVLINGYNLGTNMAEMDVAADNDIIMMHYNTLISHNEKFKTDPERYYGAISPHRDYARFLGGRSGITGHSTLQRPNSRGEIKLRSAYPIEHPAIDPKYFASDPTDLDLETMIAGVRINRNIVAQSPIRELIDYELSPSAECQTDEEIGNYIRGHMTTLYHPSSTCRMGADKMAVTDPASLKVRGLEGLHVADASVMPKMVSGNLNAPTIMIAERAARMILAG